jgi:hypothetical protein
MDDLGLSMLDIKVDCSVIVIESLLEWPNGLETEEHCFEDKTKIISR